MKEDGGEFELDTYDITLECVGGALSEHFGRQDQYLWSEYEALIKEKRFK